MAGKRKIFFAKFKKKTDDNSRMVYLFCLNFVIVIVGVRSGARNLHLPACLGGVVGNMEIA
jgi:hypothetical protein